MANHAPTRTHIISNQPASPIALAKSTAIGPKAMRYRNGFMRIVISVRPPRPLARPQYQQSAPCWDRKKPRLWWAGLRITRDIRGSQTLASAAGQFRARGLVPERKAPPKRGQVYCGRKGTLGLPQQSNSGGRGLVPTAASARHKSHRVLPQNNRCPLLPALSRQARSAREETEVNALSGIAADW